MPWEVVTKMSLIQEFIELALKRGVSITELCRRFKISRKTAYKWLRRYKEKGSEELAEKSRRPKSSPGKTKGPAVASILQLRQEHPAWGGRKIRQVLLNLSEPEVPAASTINGILKRNGMISEAQSQKHTRWQRFEAPGPNALWQMDFKGHFAIQSGRCHALTVLDDYSRYSLGLVACSDERTETVQKHLTEVFRRYGLPDKILADNGSPWGCQGQDYHTQLSVWLLLLGIRIIHGRPCHPQTTGKDERFHRTLKAEVLQTRYFQTLQDCQVAFDRWRDDYNLIRPHESLDMKTPGSRYKPATRPFPEQLPKIEYNQGDFIRKVDSSGVLYFKGKTFKAGKPFIGYNVALRPTDTDGVYAMVFCSDIIRKIDLTLSNH